MDNLFLDNVKDLIKANVTMSDVCAHYGLVPNRSGMIKCPFHNDAKPSCKIYPGSRGYFCFTCHKGGDVISFVRDYLDCSPTEAMRELAPLAGVTWESDTTLNDEMKRRQDEARQKRIEQEQKKQRAEDEYDLWASNWALLDKWKRDFAPTTSDQELDDRYVMACKGLSFASYQWDLADDRLREFR